MAVKRVLLVYPEFPPSFWGFKFAMGIIGKKSMMPPLGLITVAGMIPEEGYELKLIDMNITPLLDEHIEWADLVMTSTMVVQKKSLSEVIARCNRTGVPIVVGGPHPTSFHDEIHGADHFLLDEAEEIFPQFLEDFGNGVAEKMYRAPVKPDVTKAPRPRYDLLEIKSYRSMALQFSRGCPFDCEFCDITKLFGRVPRTKTNEQMIAELDFLYDLGWYGSLFLVDDNFVGNKREAMRLLPAITAWQKERGYPFSFFTEASLTLVESEPLMDALVEAGFSMAFLGIESPNPDTLKKSNKGQNIKKGVDNYLLHAIHTLQRKGIEVTGGFILGLDGDGPGVFDAQIDFIQEAGIPIAMVGLLSALRGTDLYHRLEREGRLLGETTGNNLDITLNFIPEMEKETLIEGYKRVLSTLYDPTLANYFKRCLTQFKYQAVPHISTGRTGKSELLAIVRSFRHQLFSRQGPEYLKFLFKTIVSYPRLLPEAIRLAIMGYHFQKHTEHAIAVSKQGELVNS